MRLISAASFAKETVAGGTIQCPLCRTYLRKEDEYGARLSARSTSEPGKVNIRISWHCRHCHTDCDVGLMPDADWWEDYFEEGHPYQLWDPNAKNARCRDAVTLRAHLAITKILKRGENRPLFQELVEADKLILEDLEDIVARLERLAPT